MVISQSKLKMNRIFQIQCARVNNWKNKNKIANKVKKIEDLVKFRKKKKKNHMKANQKIKIFKNNNMTNIIIIIPFRFQNKIIILFNMKNNLNNNSNNSSKIMNKKKEKQKKKLNLMKKIVKLKITLKIIITILKIKVYQEKAKNYKLIFKVW